MRVSEVLAGLEGVDESADIRVWADGMRVMTTRYGHVGDATDRVRVPSPQALRERFEREEPEEPRLGPRTPVVALPRKRFVTVYPKSWHIDNGTLMQTAAGKHGTSVIVHYFDPSESCIHYEVKPNGSFGPATLEYRSWCGLRSSVGDGLLATLPDNHRICKTCERKFLPLHVPCESCGVITNVEDMHTLAPGECNACHHEQERIEKPYRDVMGVSA